MYEAHKNIMYLLFITVACVIHMRKLVPLVFIHIFLQSIVHVYGMS